MKSSSFFEQNAALLMKNPELAEAFQGIMKYEKHPKHHVLHEKGKICNHFYIIISGIARVFYFKEDKDITCHFASEQESITAIDSFIQRKKSKYSIELLEETELFAISHSDLDNFFEKNPQYERFGRLFLEQIYVELVERIDDLQMLTAQERYDVLFTKKPKLFNRVSLKHIASFLGITAETLSRIRAK